MIQMNPNLKDFWLRYAPIKLLYGGRDSSKTKDTALFLTVQSMNYKLRIMCARQFQNRIEQSVYTEIKWCIEQLGVQEHFTILKNSIVCNLTGSEFFFYGIRRNIEDIKGTADIDILWIEEGEDLTKEQWERIEPTVRKEGSFIIILFNPRFETDFVWKELVLSSRKDIDRYHINYDKNPFISKKSLERIQQLKEQNYDDFLHIYLGQPKQNDEEALIKRKWLLECIDAHKKLNIEVRGNTQIGYDVADDGGDTNATALRDGRLLISIDEWAADEDELFSSTAKVYKKALEYKANIIYDANGVGAGVGSNIKKLNEEFDENIYFYGFDSAEAPDRPDSVYDEVSGITNKDYFENKKAQAWWYFKDCVRDTYNAITNGTEIEADRVVSFDSSIELLQKAITELSTPRKAQSGRLKNMVEKKKDLKKRGIDSPNIADSIIMCYYKEVKGHTKSFKVDLL